MDPLGLPLPLPPRGVVNNEKLETADEIIDMLSSATRSCQSQFHYLFLLSYLAPSYDLVWLHITLNRQMLLSQNVDWLGDQNESLLKSLDFLLRNVSKRVLLYVMH